LGALFLEWFALEGMMAIDVVTALIAIGLVFFIHIPQPAKSVAESARPTILSDLRTGFLYIWHWPSLFVVLLMSAVLNFLFTPAFTLLPLLVLNHFDGNALYLAWLNTSFGVGLVLGGIILGAWGGFRSKMLTAVLGLALSSVGTLMIGVAPPTGYWLALVGLGFFGICNTITNGSFMALMQAVVAPEMQGRFFTVLMSIVQIMSPIGLLIAGPVADRFGIQLWYLVASISMLLISAVIFLSPSLRQLEYHHATSPEVGSSQLPTLPVQGD
jgi:DHA3 family macrolide efflux protein-like MFS transporter